VVKELQRSEGAGGGGTEGKGQLGRGGTGGGAQGGCAGGARRRGTGDKWSEDQRRGREH